MADDDLLVINIDDTLDEVLGRLEHFANDQLPFAQASALYNVARDAREVMREIMPKVFTLRQKKPWAARALTFFPKSKKDLQNNIKSGQGASISIESKDKILAPLLTDGGIKKRQDGKDLGVPIVGAGRRTKHTILTRASGPDGLLRRKGKRRGFLLQTKGGYNVLFVRTKKHVKGEDDHNKKTAMFIMKRQLRIKPWWDARKILLKAMSAWLPQRFEEACITAMRTRKTK